MAITRLQKEVLRQVILAQAASDSGKWIFWDTDVPGYFKAMIGSYAVKPYHELKAVELIDSMPPCGITYWMGGAAVHSPIVYFQFGSEFLGHWAQVSFHNPGIPRTHKFRNIWKHGRETSWVGTRTPKKFTDSRVVCVRLAEACGWFIEPKFST